MCWPFYSHIQFDFGSGTSSPAKIRSGLDDSVFQYYYQLQESGNHRGGRTALHIACSRDDDYEVGRNEMWSIKGRIVSRWESYIQPKQRVEGIESGHILEFWINSVHANKSQTVSLYYVQKWKSMSPRCIPKVTHDLAIYSSMIYFICVCLTKGQQLLAGFVWFGALGFNHSVIHFNSPLIN